MTYTLSKEVGSLASFERKRDLAPGNKLIRVALCCRSIDLRMKLKFPQGLQIA